MWGSLDVWLFAFFCAALVCFTDGQQRISVNRGVGLSPQQINDLEAAYAQTVRRKRVLNVNGGNGNNAKISRQDVQNTQLLAYKELLLLGTVNFNNIIDGIEKGDVLPARQSSDNAAGVGAHRRVKRKAINTEYNVVEKWDAGTLHYRIIENQFRDPEALRTKIRSSLAPIQERTCVNFVEILSTQIFDPTRSLVEVRDTMSACASVIGRIPGEHQTMQLASGCHVTGTIQHEFMHALGFGHEHERPDRDDVLAVNSKYILSDYIRNFDKEPHPTYYSNISYDLSSIMHYSLNQFSIDSSSNTLELVNPYLAISALDVGQRIGFSWLDEVAINNYYSCEGDCVMRCENGGYVRKLDSGVCRCFCPEGLGGPSCEEVINQCGQYVDLSQHGGERTITSKDFDGGISQASNEVCFFYIKGSGYLSLTFNHFHVVCDNYLEVRAFHISQPSIGLCGDTEPAPVKTLGSPEPGTLMLIYDTTQSSSAERGWSLTARSHTDACAADPCHGGSCIPVEGSDTQYRCRFPDHPMHCEFNEGLLGACNRVRFNRYYQDKNEFQMAWQVSSNNNPRMMTTTDYTSRPQRGVATIVPHNFTGKQWCLSFKYSMSGDDEGTLKVHVIKNGQLNAQSQKFIDTEDQMSFPEIIHINIDGRTHTDSDIVEIAFESLYTNNNGGLDTIEVEQVHLIPSTCPAPSDPCARLPCGDAECSSPGGVVACAYPDDDIYCGFEEHENGCQGSLEFFGSFDSVDDADWLLNSGPTLTPNTGPDNAVIGDGYLYVESNFPPSTKATSVRAAFVRMSPRRSADRCLSFWYHMFGKEVLRIEVLAYIYDRFSPTKFRVALIEGDQGNIWKHSQVDISVNDRVPNVKIEIIIAAYGRNKYSDIAIDDVSLTKGRCDRSSVAGRWEDWSDWTDCSVTCGSGQRSRSRQCIPPINGGADCSGDATETEACNIVCGVDGALTTWSPWGTCSETCGGGTQSRSRTCTPPVGGGQPCPAGELSQSQDCGTAFCPINGVWSDWNFWGSCSVPVTAACGQSGVRVRERRCTNPPPQHGGLQCEGTNLDSLDCGTAPCSPIDSVVSSWSDWSECTLSCGTGQTTRTRLCTSEARNGGITCTARGLSESEACNTEPCPVDATVSDWSTWTSCSVTCADGLRTKTRTCVIEAQNGGQACADLGLTTEETCKDAECPVDATVGDWSGWSGCSVTCGDGTRTRTRPCVTEQLHGGQSCADKGLTESETCSDALCIVDATLSNWEDWSSCSQTCGGGDQTRTRNCLTPPENGGKTCAQLGGLSESETCNEDSCPVGGVLSEWTTWSDCNVGCGDGQQERTRTCTAAENGGTPCDSENLSETQMCFVAPGCPVDGALSDWTEWTSCSLTCGGGDTTRSRTCTPPQNGGQDCGSSALEQTVSCNTDPCPVDGVLSAWTEWSTCDVTCGTGSQRRDRVCTPPLHGGQSCDGELTRITRTCNDQPCPIDGVWQPWSGWICSVTCGSGTETRQRECDGPHHGGEDCSGDAQQSQSCSASVTNCPINAVDGEWTQWATCTTTCGMGTTTRTRTCTPPQFGGQECEASQDSQNCVIRPCATNGVARPWSDWSDCSVTCEIGTHTRTRTCTLPRNGGVPCNVPLSETQACQGRLLSCLVGYNEWQDWTTCSATCGPSGTRTRRRTCTGRALCNGIDDVENSACNTQITCPVDGAYSQWSPWSICTVTCDSGVQSRSRTCSNPVAGGDTCDVLGPPSETRPCGPTCVTAVDGVWQQWADWTQCSQTCGGGTRSRSRTCTQPSNGGQTCQGNNEMSESCNGNECQVTEGFTPWSSWSVCSTATCRRSNPSAFHFRTRSCIARCNSGSRFEFERCVPDCDGTGGATRTTTTSTTSTTTTSTTTTAPGTVNGIWGSWSQWTTCLVACEGRRSRLRSCNAINNNTPGLITCPGDSLERSDCSEDSNCNQLISGNSAKVCESFEGNRQLSAIGAGTFSRSEFRINSGPSPNYLTSAGMGLTGPNWAADGTSYLLMSSLNTRSRKEFRFNTAFDFTNGACVELKYTTFGSGWTTNSRLELALVSVSTNRYSTPLWSERTSSNPSWQSTQVNIAPQQVLFDQARVALIVVGGGGREGDLAIDDFQMTEGRCQAGTVICPKPEAPTSHSCSFESGDDCSWIVRTVEANGDVWRVWRGPTPTQGTGPNSAQQGQNYLYLEADKGELGVRNLRAGQGCLTFFYNMQGQGRRMGTFSVKLASGLSLFSNNRNRGARWRRQRVTVTIPQTTTGNQIIFSHTARGRNAREDIAIDNITYRSGSGC